MRPFMMLCIGLFCSISSHAEDFRIAIDYPANGDQLKANTDHLLETTIYPVDTNGEAARVSVYYYWNDETPTMLGSAIVGSSWGVPFDRQITVPNVIDDSMRFTLYITSSADTFAQNDTTVNTYYIAERYQSNLSARFIQPGLQSHLERGKEHTFRFWLKNIGTDTFKTGELLRLRAQLQTTNLTGTRTMITYEGPDLLTDDSVEITYDLLIPEDVPIRMALLCTELYWIEYIPQWDIFSVREVITEDNENCHMVNAVGLTVDDATFAQPSIVVQQGQIVINWPKGATNEPQGYIQVYALNGALLAQNAISGHPQRLPVPQGNRLVLVQIQGPKPYSQLVMLPE